MKRRDVLRTLAAGPLPIGAGLLAGRDVLAQAPPLPEAPRGLPTIRIKDIKVVLTAPNRIRLVVVKVITDQPGLQGWGCATFTQRALVVQTAVVIDFIRYPHLADWRADPGAQGHRVATLRELEPLTGAGKYVFPSIRTRQRNVAMVPGGGIEPPRSSRSPGF